MTPPHIARAQAVQSYLSSVASFLERLGATVVLDMLADRTLAAVTMSVTFKGPPERAYGLRGFVEGWARERGITLHGAVLSDLPEGLRHADLQPGEQRVGFVATFARQKAAA
jgi:hypothetical protein